MAKTGKQIEGDIRKLILDSQLYHSVSGNIYRENSRPKDNLSEDIVVIFTSGIPSEVQTGIVTVNIYIPYIDPYYNGVLTEDGERCEEVERIAQAWVNSLTCDVSCYKFALAETIHTTEDESINQSFVVIKLAYEYYGDDYAPINTNQESYIDATDTDEDKSYEPILTDEDGNPIVIDPANIIKDYPQI